MKLLSLSNEFLKCMARNYKFNHKRTFSFDFFKEKYPDLDDNFISDALYLLQKDGFISIFFADGIAYSITLFPNAIRSVEEDTFIKKGYSVLKEIRSWI